MATNPTLLLVPIAENGTKNTLPETQATPGDGLMSQSTGFPAECSLPLGAGGVAPDRADFNGAFNLLGGVAFYAQKGFTFQYENTQDYYKGCVVIDTADGNRYECIADMTAGTVAPHNDTANNYWVIVPVGVFNKKDVVSSSGNYQAPVTGWYKITVKGGGGGGGGAYEPITNTRSGGAGGGEGGTTIAYEKLTKNQLVAVTIGAGGSGGTSQSGFSGTQGGNGGNTTVVVNGNTYIGGGGYGSTNMPGAGGSGTIVGCAGITGNPSANYTNASSLPGPGGGAGGGTFSSSVSRGGGGLGGYWAATDQSYKNAVAGGAGFAWFEYFDPTI